MRLSRSTPQRSYTLVVVLIVVALLLIILDQSGRLGSARTYAQTWLNPVLGGLSTLAWQVASLRAPGSDVAQLQTENEQLKARISTLERQQIKGQTLVQENEQLRKQLGIEQEKPWKLQKAAVSAVSPDDGRHVVLLSVGSEDEVQVGMAVIGQMGSGPPALIGVVEAVGPHAATVLLITDFSSAISAHVYHAGSAANGVVEGQWQRGSRLRLAQVERTQPLAAGDVVVTAGLTAKLDLDLPRAAIPRDVPIGVVETTRPDGQSQIAEVRPYVDPDQVQYAWVILSHDG